MTPKRISVVTSFVLLVLTVLVFRPREQSTIPSSALPLAAPIAEMPAPLPDQPKPTAVATPSIPVPIPAVADSPVGRFQAWTQRYLAAPAIERATLEVEGVRLAEERRPVFKEVIVSDPRAALEKAVPMAVRQALPMAVLARLEERVNGRGALRVYQGVGADNVSPAKTVRVAEMAGGKTYEARIYGRRAEDVKSVASTSLHGVALDQEFAVSEDPIRPLEIGERPDPLKTAVAFCPVSGKASLPADQVAEPISEAK